jgi:uncharacterized protein YegP (UPF0339 family)
LRLHRTQRRAPPGTGGALNGQWFFRIVASNNQTLAHSETYWNRSDAVSAARLIINQAGSGTIEG